MTNELRLLKAWIEAQGYEVKSIKIGQVEDDNYNYEVTKKKKNTHNRQALLYTPQFEEFWRAYPERCGSNPKNTAFGAWNSQLTSSLDSLRMIASMIEGAKRYRTYCEQTEKMNTEFVLMASTFLGKQAGFMEKWTCPVKKITLPGDEKLAQFASENGLPSPGKGETYFQYRKRLQREIAG